LAQLSYTSAKAGGAAGRISNDPTLSGWDKIAGASAEKSGAASLENISASERAIP
jgi:hypothetical protein